jgi:CBS domain-containing protein
MMAGALGRGQLVLDKEETMARTVREVMTRDLRTVGPDSTLTEAAREMRDGDVGPVLILDGDGPSGILTDRDIVVRAIADGRDANSTKVSDIATGGLIGVEADQEIDAAVELMRENDIRRLVVTEGGRPVGIVSIGDIAVERDTDSALADISAGSPNN